MHYVYTAERVALSAVRLLHLVDCEVRGLGLDGVEAGRLRTSEGSCHVSFPWMSGKKIKGRAVYMRKILLRKSSEVFLPKPFRREPIL